jgi:hypothetical protein
VSKAVAVGSTVQSEMTEALIKQTAASFALYTEHRNWMMAQVMALPEDVQGKYKKAHGGKKAHGDM